MPGFAIGTQVGQYRITGELGGGGMGVVYRAVHGQLDRPTAIKVLRPELGRNMWALDRDPARAARIDPRRARRGERARGVVRRARDLESRLALVAGERR
jgi:serine/threonine protein kinase